MRKKLARRIAAVSVFSTLSFTLVACPSSDDQTTQESPENESPENESPENEKDSPENESPENESPENEGSNSSAEP
jgi:hypothetical protein